MADEKELLEAARMIKRHCENTKIGSPCCFAVGGTCKDGCCVGDYDFPCSWEIGKRWKTADIEMANALKIKEYEAIMRQSSTNYVIVIGKNNECWTVPGGFFDDLKPGEKVMLSDVIKEGE